MVGRDEAVRTIAADLIADRFVTIVGPGGMGKTTVAVSVSHAMLEEFAGAVCLVDLGAIADPRLVACDPNVSVTPGVPAFSKITCVADSGVTICASVVAFTQHSVNHESPDDPISPARTPLLAPPTGEL